VGKESLKSSTCRQGYSHGAVDLADRAAHQSVFTHTRSGNQKVSSHGIFDQMQKCLQNCANGKTRFNKKNLICPQLYRNWRSTKLASVFARHPAGIALRGKLSPLKISFLLLFVNIDMLVIICCRDNYFSVIFMNNSKEKIPYENSTHFN